MGASQMKCFLAGTAVAIILAAAASPSFAASESQTIEAAIPVPEPAAVPPPTAADIGALATALMPANQAIADKLLDLATGKFDRIFNDKKERTAVDAFYSARGYAPLWITGGAANGRARATIAYLNGVEADGLDPADYPTPDFKAAAEPGVLAEAELRLTASVLTYARHAQVGRVQFSRISSDIYYSQLAPEPGEVLAKVAEAKNVRQALESFNPPHEGYKALKQKLAEARGQKGSAGRAWIASGPVLTFAKVPMADARVPRLRERLGISGDAGNTTYDKTLAAAVAKFQQQHGLTRNGHLNSATVDALNGPRRDRDADIIMANMERWRWLPRDLGHVYVMLNIPDFTLKVVNNGATVWTTKVVVGKPSTPTPIFSDTMKFITVNPTWNVPPSIIYNEYLPALRQDPQALERIGLRLVHKRDGSVHIYQPPGERNALGRIRFNFPNKFLVYQHDTPDKRLFAHEKRAYSHGCMRVQDPVKYAELLLSIVMPEEGYTQERIRKMFGRGERNIQLPMPIPVHITYQTAYVDAAGKLVIRADLYSRDTRVLAALKGDERRITKVAMERPRSNYSRPPVRLPRRHEPAASDGTPFFERLFGGGGPTVPRVSINGRRVLAR